MQPDAAVSGLLSQVPEYARNGSWGVPLVAGLDPEHLRIARLWERIGNGEGPGGVPGPFGGRLGDHVASLTCVREMI